MSRPKPSPMCLKMTPSWLPIELFSRFHQTWGHHQPHPATPYNSWLPIVFLGFTSIVFLGFTSALHAFD